MGEKMGGLLDLFGIPYRTLGEATVEADAVWAAERVRATAVPAALVVRPGLFA